MYEVIFLILLAFVWIILASAQDLKKREVDNWINFSLIAFAIGFRFFYSLFSESVSWNFFYQGLIGLGIFFILGNLFYYARFFAGGDAKLLIALGAVVPFTENFFFNLNIFVLFIFLLFFVGGVYGIFWSVVLVKKNSKNFNKEFSRQFKKNSVLIKSLFFLGVIFFLSSFLNSLFFLLGFFFILFPLLFLYAKTVDEICMVQKLKSSELREGDWLYKDVSIGKNVIKSKWDGLSKKEIAMIKKKHKYILIKQGIPFIPVFFFAFLILVLIYYSDYGNLLGRFIFSSFVFLG